MKRLLLTIVLVLLAAPAFAQSAKPTDKFVWTQDDGATAADAQKYRYELELDGVLLPTPLVATCTGTARPWTCKAPIPPITPSQHTARIRTVDVSLPAVLEWIFSEYSDPLVFTMRATPNKPRGLSIGQ